MFKRKCHQTGQAIKNAHGLLIMCQCLTGEDIQTVLDWKEKRV